MCGLKESKARENWTYGGRWRVLGKGKQRQKDAFLRARRQETGGFTVV